MPVTRHVREQEAGDPAGRAARCVVNVSAVLGIPMRFTVNPCVQPTECDSARCELAAAPNLHALHVLFRLFAHERIIPGVHRLITINLNVAATGLWKSSKNRSFRIPGARVRVQLIGMACPT
jgi:hypothetical protein